jgi:hypothetical protein
MFELIPYWMWAASLLVLTLVCGAALSAHDSARVGEADQRVKWRSR